MSDVVVVVPLSFGLDTWIDEGDAAGEPWSGEEWDFYLAGLRPNIKPGDRVYVVYNGALRGYAPLLRLDTPADSYYVRRRGASAFSLVRGGGAVAVTIPEYIQGFRGWRYRWWGYPQELPFPSWQNPSACIGWERPSRPVKNKPASRSDDAPRENVIRCGLALSGCQHKQTVPSPFDPRFMVCADCGRPVTR